MNAAAALLFIFINAIYYKVWSSWYRNLIMLTCYYTNFSWQRMDLGECPKIHDLALRADYEKAQQSRDYFYDLDVSIIYQNLSFFT